MPIKFPKLNQVILLIIVSEFILVTAQTIISPIYAIFITQDIAPGAVEVVGFSIAIYWIVKSILQLPVARYLDKNHGEIDDYYSMLSGLLLTTAAAFLFYFAKEVWHIYALQFLVAGTALLNVMLGDPLPAGFAKIEVHLQPLPLNRRINTLDTAPNGVFPAKPKNLFALVHKLLR